jgi:hypothetical protein
MASSNYAVLTINGIEVKVWGENITSDEIAFLSFREGLK